MTAFNQATRTHRTPSEIEDARGTGNEKMPDEKHPYRSPRKGRNSKQPIRKDILQGTKLMTTVNIDETTLKAIERIPLPADTPLQKYKDFEPSYFKPPPTRYQGMKPGFVTSPFVFRVLSLLCFVFCLHFIFVGFDFVFFCVLKSKKYIYKKEK